MKLAKKVLLLLCFAFLFSLVLHLRHYADYQTTLLPGIYIRDGSSDLAAKKWSVPLVYDWDGDGKKDLLVGHKDGTHGYISFYKNTRSDESPAFSGFTYIQKCGVTCAPLDAAADA